MSRREIDREIAAHRRQAKKQRFSIDPVIRVVLDTNVVMWATLRDHGLPAAILDLAIGGVIQLFISEPVFAEYKEVPTRPRLKIAPQRIARSLAVIPKMSQRITPTRAVAVIRNDEPLPTGRWPTFATSSEGAKKGCLPDILCPRLRRFKSA